jgi:hypothetical protein
MDINISAMCDFFCILDALNDRLPIIKNTKMYPKKSETGQQHPKKGAQKECSTIYTPFYNDLWWIQTQFLP